MGRYSSRVSRPLGPSYMNRKVHPIWRGVGFAMMILIPLISFFTADLLLLENARKKWIVFPDSLIMQGQADPMILVKILSTIAIALVLYVILMLVSFFIYRMIAPPRYGPLDVPPVSYRGKPFKR